MYYYRIVPLSVHRNSRIDFTKKIALKSIFTRLPHHFKLFKIYLYNSLFKKDKEIHELHFSETTTKSKTNGSNKSKYTRTRETASLETARWSMTNRFHAGARARSPAFKCVPDERISELTSVLFHIIYLLLLFCVGKILCFSVSKDSWQNRFFNRLVKTNLSRPPISTKLVFSSVRLSAAMFKATKNIYMRPLKMWEKTTWIIGGKKMDMV